MEVITFNSSLENTTNASMINNWQTDLEDLRKFEHVVHLVVSVIFGIITVSGIVGNLSVIIAFWCSKQMQNTTNILIASLAAADFLFIVFCVPFTMVRYILDVWPFGEAWCKISSYMKYTCEFLSVYSLLFISLERYLAVVHPVSSIKIRTRRNAYLLVVSEWIIIISSNLPTIFKFYVIEYKFYGENRSTCLMATSFNDVSARTFHVCFFVFGYILPLTGICILYGFILKKLLCGKQSSSSQRTESMKLKKKVTIMVIAVVGVFALCWLPLQIFLIILYFGNIESTIFTFSIQVTCNCMAYVNSCVNPILYAFFNKNFRQNFKKLLCCKGKSSSTQTQG